MNKSTVRYVVIFSEKDSQNSLPWRRLRNQWHCDRIPRSKKNVTERKIKIPRMLNGAKVIVVRYDIC